MKRKSETQNDRVKQIIPHAAVVEREELSEKHKLVNRILARRDAIAARTGTLSESYTLVREDRER